jgi:hypothetical protein
MRPGTLAWTEIVSITMYDRTSPRFPLERKVWHLIALNLMPGQINIERSVDVLLKRRVHV